MESLFKTEKGRKEILELYDEKLESLGITYEYQKVNTSFGDTNIIVTGSIDSPPLILIHGSNGCAPIALETYPELNSKFRVYAVDVLAQPNKSAETRLSMKDESYGVWMNEIINTLQLNSVTMVGFSFGGLVILKTLEHSELKIKEVYLAAPAYIVNGNPITAMFKIFLPMKKFIRTGRIGYLERFLENLFTEKDAFALKFLQKVIPQFDMDFTPVPVIKTEKAKNISTPITLFASEKDMMFPGKKMIKRATKIFPSLKEAKMFDHAKHVHGTAQNKIIEAHILEK